MMRALKAIPLLLLAMLMLPIAILACVVHLVIIAVVRGWEMAEGLIDVSSDLMGEAVDG